MTCDTTHHSGCACHEATHAAEIARLRAELAAAQADLVPLRRLASMIVGWGVTGHAASVEDTAALVRDLFCVNSEGYTHPTPLSQRCIDAAKEAQNGK